MNASNTPRSLDVIGADLRKLRNIFDSGALLVEASEACEHGEWLDWLETYFDASEDTARRHMAAYRLSLKYRTVRDLKVPPTIIYRLADEFIDDPDLPVIIKALVKESGTAEKPLNVGDCEDVIHLTRARKKWGNFPDATLVALERLAVNEKAWSAGAIEQLKQERPDSKEAVDKIVLTQHRRHLETLFDGALPDWLDGALPDYLDGVEPKRRKQVLAKLQAATQPLDEDQVFNIIYDDVRRADQDGEEDHDDEDQDDDAEIVPTPMPLFFDDPDLNAEFLGALRVIVHHARRPMPTSIGGINGAELVEAARFLDKLHELATGGSTVKRIADRAEARSRSGRAANGEGLTERWSES
jgi:hypothetical protein